MKDQTKKTQNKVKYVTQGSSSICFCQALQKKHLSRCLISQFYIYSHTHYNIAKFARKIGQVGHELASYTVHTIIINIMFFLIISIIKSLVRVFLILLKLYTTSPASTTTLVSSDEPDAIFVNTQAASNCNDGLERGESKADYATCESSAQHQV